MKNVAQAPDRRERQPGGGARLGLRLAVEGSLRPPGTVPAEGGHRLQGQALCTRLPTPVLACFAP